MKSKYIKIVVAFFFLFSLVILTIVVKQKQETRSRAATLGPLHVHPANPRYFADSSGKAVYLAGEHTWTNVQERSYNPNFDYNAYLNFMTSTGQNFIRMWTMATLDTFPQPWVVSGGKADFSKFDDAYFTRLRTRIQQARNRGIYVSVMLADGGWTFQGGNCAQYLFNPANNVNGIGNGSCADSIEGKDPAIIAIWHAYADKLIQTVDDLDNVIYEIFNESVTSSIPFQKDMVNYMKTRTAKPVGMTCTNGAQDDLFTSNSDWVSPCEEGVPAVATGDKVIISDGDHWGEVSVDNVWKNFTRGINIIAMDCNHTGCRAASNDFTVFDWDRALGDTVKYGNKMNLAAMTPQANLSSTSYALAAPGAEYLVYQPGSGSFTVTLDAGTYTAEWLNPATSQASSAETVNGGGSSTFTPPFNGAAVLYLKNTSITGIPKLLTFT